jgi:hypothetical protein
MVVMNYYKWLLCSSVGHPTHPPIIAKNPAFDVFFLTDPAFDVDRETKQSKIMPDKLHVVSS